MMPTMKSEELCEGWVLIKSELVPILRVHSNHRELFDVTQRLHVNLTNPELLLFKEELPED